MKVVIDTNVFISSFFNPDGRPRKIIDLWKKEKVVLCLSGEILEEYIEVLARLGLEGEQELEELLGLFRKRVNMEFVVPEGDLKLIIEDPADDKFVVCAEAAGAKVIISGDKHLKDLGRYKDIFIRSPKEFLDSFVAES